jgi:transcriptional regulator with XRE-family HTH domain
MGESTPAPVLKPLPADATVGELVRRAREAKSITLRELATELKLPLRHLEAIESDDWDALPPGRARPLARQLAARLDVDLDFHTGAFQVVPGVQELEPPDPRQERLERVVMGVLTAASVLVVLWLVVPGPSLGRKARSVPVMALSGRALPPPPPPSTAPNPVLGELLPEAPLNAQGILVSLRAMDTCEVRIQLPPEAGPAQTRSMRVSEPWRLRVKGPFDLILDNAGVVNVEVAGRRIPHGQNVGEGWTGHFDAEGRWLRPVPPAPPEEPTLPDDEEETP